MPSDAPVRIALVRNQRGTCRQHVREMLKRRGPRVVDAAIKIVAPAQMSCLDMRM